MSSLGILEDRREIIICKVFDTTLKDAILVWFNNFKGRVNIFFEELIRRLKAQFSYSIKVI